MEPIPETREALDELDPTVADHELLSKLKNIADRVQEVVPDCVGLSVAHIADDVVFTLVATAPEIAVLDAIQYLMGGPCVDAVEEGGRVIETAQRDLLDEASWRLLGRATSGAGIASTLTMPIMKGDEVIGSVNLYGASASAFKGHHEQLAEIVGAWVGGAVTNADLSFQTRRAAQLVPQRLRQQNQIDAAVGLLAAKYGLSIDDARHRLSDAAERAGITEAAVAEAILAAHQDPPGS